MANLFYLFDRMFDIVRQYEVFIISYLKWKLNFPSLISTLESSSASIQPLTYWNVLEQCPTRISFTLIALSLCDWEANWKLSVLIDLS